MLVSAILEVVGIVIALYTMREVFRDIFHPTLSGSLSDFVGRVASMMFRSTRLRPAVGPGALVTVIILWVFGISVGFAFIYFPLFSHQLGPSEASVHVGRRILRSLYMSMGALGTFQVFDVEIRSSWVRLVVALEGLIGILLITASVSWLVLLYPALQRTRLLARRILVIARAAQASGVARIEDDQLVAEMAGRVLQARIDLVLFPLLMNFYPTDRSETLARTLPYLQHISEACMEPGCKSAVRFAAFQLHEALMEFSKMLSERVVDSDPEDLAATFGKFAALDQ